MHTNPSFNKYALCYNEPRNRTIWILSPRRRMYTLFYPELAQFNRVNKKHNLGKKLLIYDSYLLFGSKSKIIHSVYDMLRIKTVKRTKRFSVSLKLMSENV